MTGLSPSGTTTTFNNTKESTMDLTSISTEGSIWTNEEAPITEPMEGEQALAEVEVSDDNQITIHMRHWSDTQACLSFSTTRAGALALSEVLRAAAGKTL